MPRQGALSVLSRLLPGRRARTSDERDADEDAVVARLSEDCADPRPSSFPLSSAQMDHVDLNTEYLHRLLNLGFEEVLCVC